MAGGLSCRHMAEGQGSQVVVGEEGEAGVQREEMSWGEEPTALDLLVPVVQAQVYSALFSWWFTMFFSKIPPINPPFCLI